MSSPAKNSKIDSPDRKIYPLSQNPNDLDFLTQKIVRLEEDYAEVCA